MSNLGRALWGMISAWQSVKPSDRGTFGILWFPPHSGFNPVSLCWGLNSAVARTWHCRDVAHVLRGCRGHGVLMLASPKHSWLEPKDHWVSSPALTSSIHTSNSGHHHPFKKENDQSLSGSCFLVLCFALSLRKRADVKKARCPLCAPGLLQVFPYLCACFSLMFRLMMFSEDTVDSQNKGEEFEFYGNS